MKKGDMTRAEQAALKAYPVKGEWVGNQYGEWDADINRFPRTNFQEGYEQAEKDIREELLAWAEEQIAHHEKMLKNYPNEREYMAFVGAYQNMVDKLKTI